MESPSIHNLLRSIDASLAKLRWRTIAFAAPASKAASARLAATLGLKRLPEALQALLDWHDGQPPEARGVHPAFSDQLLMSTEQMIATGVAERSLMDKWRNHAQLTLFSDESGANRIVVEVRGERLGGLQYLNAEGAVCEEWPSLQAFIAEVARLLSHELAATVRARQPDAGVILSLSQRFKLAIPATINEGNGDCHTLLGGTRPMLEAYDKAQALSYWYGIENVEELQQSVKELLELDANDDGVAFNLIRASLIAGWGYGAGYWSAEDAWKVLDSSARLAQERFSDWETFSSSYTIGRNQREEEIGHPFDTPPQGSSRDEIIQRLLAPGGLWQQIPFDTPLEEDAPPPAPAVNRWLASCDGNGAPPLDEVLGSLQPGDLIQLLPGRYAPLVIEGCVALEGLGEVVIEGGKAPAITLSHNSLSISNVTLHSEDTAVLLRHGALLGAKLAIRAGQVAVLVKEATAHLSDCFIEAGGEGILLQEGKLIVENTEVLGCKTGIYNDGCDLYVSGGEIHDCIEHGIYSQQGSNRILQSRIAACDTAIEVRGKQTLVRDSLMADGQNGVLVFDGAYLILRESQIRNMKEDGLRIDTDSKARLLATTIQENGECGIYLMGAASLYGFKLELIEPTAAPFTRQQSSRVLLIDSLVRCPNYSLDYGGTATVAFFNCTLESGGGCLLEQALALLYQCQTQGPWQAQDSSQLLALETGFALPPMASDAASLNLSLELVEDGNPYWVEQFKEKWHLGKAQEGTPHSHDVVMALAFIAGLEVEWSELPHTFLAQAEDAAPLYQLIQLLRIIEQDERLQKLIQLI